MSRWHAFLWWWGRRQGWWPMDSSRAADSWRRKKKIAAWPLLATFEWCRLYPAIIRGAFLAITSHNNNWNLNFFILLLQMYLLIHILYVPFCAGCEARHRVLWQTIFSWGCLRRNQQFPAAPQYMLKDDNNKKRTQWINNDRSVCLLSLVGSDMVQPWPQGHELSLSKESVNALRTLEKIESNGSLLIAQWRNLIVTVAREHKGRGH